MLIPDPILYQTLGIAFGALIAFVFKGEEPRKDLWEYFEDKKVTHGKHKNKDSEIKPRSKAA